jgi:hypothetical protein
MTLNCPFLLPIQLMQFQLPSNLQQELLAYDPKLKALAKQQENKKPTKKAKYPLGKIPYLIPEDVVRASYQDDAIERINASAAPNRYHRFTKVVDIATPQARTITTAIIYHYEQCWYAAWLPPKGQEDNYVYGYAYGFKDTAAAAKVLPRMIWTSREKCTQHELGRGSIAYTYSTCITKEMIVAGDDTRNWRAMGIGSYYQKSMDIHACINQFEDELRATIPTWTDCRSMFDRIKCKSLLDALEFPSALTNVIDDKSKFQLTVDDMVSLANTWLSKNNYTSTTYLSIEKIQHIITTPFIKKQLQLMLDKSVSQYNNPDNEHRKYIKYGYKEFEQTTNSIYMINQIWPDCPVDHYRTYFDQLRTINLNHLRCNEQLITWLRKHMNVSSFFNMMVKHAQQAKQDNRRLSTFGDHDYLVYTWFEMNDTFSMIMRVLDHDKELDAPKRWRMPDFHDYVQAEAWKVINRKEALHQDLFPAPIKVNVDGSDWAFFQPVDTHQLAQWGQAVRNCVGSAGRYADDIKKRKHFIVLCMIDSNPTFTIQLDVSMGVMNVVQIAGVANQRLSVDQHEQYSTAFKEALQSREKELASA